MSSDGDTPAAPPWTATVLTIFPEMFPGPLAHSLAGRALARGGWRLDAVDIRAATTDRHQTVDDTPFGGGAGMVMRPDVVARAVDAATEAGAVGPRLYLSPRGVPLRQERVRALAEGPGVVLLCGRYEGVDARVIGARGFAEVSLGDFVLSGGELAAMTLIDACVRLLPGVVGCQASVEDESFADGLLEYPHFTRPQVWEGHAVPEVLTSGHHGRITSWRRQEALRATRERRPDLLCPAALAQANDDGPPAAATGQHEEERAS
jgi:tRNA (guanine37-N1)-methyltransferase